MYSDYKLRCRAWAKRQIRSLPRGKRNLVRHEETFIHKAAIAFLTESPADDAGLLPSVSTFKNTLHLTQSGRASSSSIIGGAKKLRTLQWCLAESKRSMHLEFLLKDAMSISLSCDKRNTRFVLRCRA